MGSNFGHTTTSEGGRRLGGTMDHRLVAAVAVCARRAFSSPV